MDTPVTVAATEVDAFAAEMAAAEIAVIDDPAMVRLKSRDFFWYSPVLKEQLNDKKADLVVCPRSEAEIIAIARACVAHRLPLTVRGGGTGNYGQAVPLAGGIVLDMTGLDRIEWVRPGLVRVQPGKKMGDIDLELKPQGWELRMHPSTKRSATIGGFVAGGSGGIGSITYGGLREPGNVAAARIVTLETEPRVLELRGKDALAVNHGYGTTGIITSLEMPLAPLWPWLDVIAAFDRFEDAARCGHALMLADGIVKKLATPIAWPIPAYFKTARDSCPEGQAILIAMVADSSFADLAALVAAHGGTVTFSAPLDESPGARPLYEFTWNHTTLHALKIDKDITYLQSLFPPERTLELVAEIGALFPDELLPHLEFIRYAGRPTAAGLHLIRYRDPERLREIFAMHEKRGIMIADPHVFTLEDGTRHKKADADQLGFKHKVDPFGLMNPGKMRSFVPQP
jgi:FAD/FMN-containing dehydrogenase